MSGLSQLHLPLNPPRGDADPRERLALLVETLRGRGWVLARDLRREGFNDRELRALVESDTAADILSYPGSPGYKLTAEATLEELDRVESLRSQSRHMLRRYLRLQRRRHKGAL